MKPKKKKNKSMAFGGAKLLDDGSNMCLTAFEEISERDEQGRCWKKTKNWKPADMLF